MQQPEIVSLENAATLSVIRFNAQMSFKSAILPFYFINEEPRFVVYAPVPQHEGEHGRILPYQIARGTMRSEYQFNGKTIWTDKGRRKIPDGAEWVRDETPPETALREAKEELGLPTEAVQKMFDCGHLPYQNPRGTVYSLHVFLAQIKDGSVLDFPDPYACAARLDGVTLSQARELSKLPEESANFESRPFKKTYLTLLEVLHDTVKEYCR